MDFILTAEDLEGYFINGFLGQGCGFMEKVRKGFWILAWQDWDFD